MRKISINTIMFIGVFLGIFIAVTYARSMTVLYGSTEMILAAVCLLVLLVFYRKVDKRLLLIAVGVTLLSFFNGLLRGEIKSVILLSLSVLLPLVISGLPLRAEEDNRCCRWAFFLGAAIVLLEKNFTFFDGFDSNTLGFLSYMCLSVGFIWFLCCKNKLIPAVVLLIVVPFVLNTGSRNVAIVTAVTVLLLLLPKKWYTKKTVFRVLYLSVLVYTVFASAIMERGFEIPWLSDLLTDFTEQHSEKSWEMEKRIVFLQDVKIMVENMPLFNKLFGEGVVLHHGHNMFYQSVFIYGYIGTAFIYVFFIRIFEMARKLVADHGDKIALGCTIALLGCFMLNGADVFLIGNEACSIIPQVLMGVILFRYRETIHSPERIEGSVRAHEPY